MKGKTALVQANYHTHTRRCLHAGGTDEEYVQAAIKDGYRILGFSDHSVWKYDSDFIPRMRMRLEQFQEYKQSVLSLKEKYRDRIEILLGMEAEYYPRYMDWLLDFVIEQDVEYLIFGNHYHESDETGQYFGRSSREAFDTYIETTLAGLKTGMYSYLAHPELPLRGLDWDEDMRPGFECICRYCRDHEIPLEYNVLGIQANKRQKREGYPNHHFWQIAGQFGCTAIIGMDAHHPKDLRASLYWRARHDLEKYGVTLTDTIRRVDFRALREQKRQDPAA